MPKYSRNCDNRCKKQVFQLYKKRKTAKAIGTVNKLFAYYPCKILITNEDGSTIYGGVMWYETEFGNKISTSFSKDRLTYYQHVVPLFVRLLNTPGFYSELSDALGHILSKHQVPRVEDVDTIMKVVGVDRDTILVPGHELLQHFKNRSRIKRFVVPYSYYRRIHGFSSGGFYKTLFGRPCLNGKMEGSQCDKECFPVAAAEPEPEVVAEAEANAVVNIDHGILEENIITGGRRTRHKRKTHRK